VLFRQFVDDDLGCASYLIGDAQAGEAALVDPVFDIDPFLEEAHRRGIRITRVLETHNHADHLSGHGRLALDHGAAVAIHPLAEPDYPFEPLADRAAIDVGEVSIGVLHTPGHRPEHCCFTVADRARADEPWLVLTGDSLFVGDVARPDLAVAAREGAEGLYESLQRLLALPDGVEVYPGHVAGSLCGVGMSSKASSTIGFERRFNGALDAMDAADFVAAQLGSSAPRPPNMDRIVALNRGPFVGAPPPLAEVDAADDASVLDVRDAEDYAAGHVPGAFNVPVRSDSFATKAGFVLDPSRPVVLHASSPVDAERAACRLRAIGLLSLRGHLVRPAAPARLHPIDLDELERMLAANAVEVLDVRDKDERDLAYIPGTRHLPFRQVRACADELDRGRPIVTICETGSRATVAASVLDSLRFEARPVLGTGVSEWKASGRPVAQFRRCGT
jgi:hydroxyacylglutathione hydrolase